MFDPTLNEIREEIAEEREIAAEKARMDRKVALLKQLASVSEAIDRDIDDLKTRRDALKGARKAVKAVADDEEITVEELGELINQVNAARGVVSINMIFQDPFAKGGAFHDGGLIRG